MDRIELGTQSLREYKGFAEDNETVQATENTGGGEQADQQRSRQHLNRHLDPEDEQHQGRGRRHE